MTWIDATILGIVEGLTEFLPISSTAHLMLASRFLEQEQTDFHKTFMVAIQPGAILAVVILYWRRLLTSWPVMQRVAIAFLPTALLGAMLYKLVDEFLENDYLALAALAIGGVILIVFERFAPVRQETEKELATISIGQCLGIGVCQAIAFVPGVSRSAATILGGMILGLSRRAAVEFSFLLAVPTMAAATTLKLYQHRSNPELLTNIMPLVIGFVTSFIIAILSIRFLLFFVRNFTFVPFGIYRIVLALVVLWLLI